MTDIKLNLLIAGRGKEDMQELKTNYVGSYKRVVPFFKQNASKY